ncbi:MAG: methylase [Candidatus Poribacteria bacterium]|nr:methylase [Candidatus Poribacteria bacterium]
MDEVKYNWVVENNSQQWWDSFFAHQGLMDHTAKGFPDLYHQIFQHLIAKYNINPEEHIILDPMCGIGTTPILANINKFDCIGVELEEVYFKDMIGFIKEETIDMFGTPVAIKQKIMGTVENYLQVTGRLIEREGYDNFMKSNKDPFYRYKSHFGNIDIYNNDSTSSNFYGALKNLVLKDINKKLVVVTSPPYTRISEHDQKQIDAMPENIRGGFRPAGYKDPNNIAMMMPYEYRMAMSKIYKNLYDLGVELMVLVTRDFILNGEVVKLGMYNKSCAEFPAPRFELVEMIKAKIPTQSFFKRINFEKHHKDKGLPMIDWEDVFIYRRKEVI